MEKELTSILRSLVVEYHSNEHLWPNYFNHFQSLRFGSIPKPGCYRDAGMISMENIIYVDLDYIRQMMYYFIRSFDASIQLYDFISKNQLWHCECEPYSQNSGTYQHVTRSITGGFLCRNFQLNNNQMIISDASFLQAKNELLLFLGKDYVEKDIYVNLIGVTGDVPIIELTENVSILKADYKLAKTFCQYYSNPYNHSPTLELFEGDYVLHINHKVLKKEYDTKNGGKAGLIEKEFIEKWINVPLLTCPGYFEIGKQIQVSSDWPLIFHVAVGPHGRDSQYDFFNRRPISMDDGTILRLKGNADIIKDLDLKKLDNKIKYSIERFKKAKCAFNINDRIVELSISFEYLINTKEMDITLQLCLKIIKLVYDDNCDEFNFTMLKKFYKYRSKIVHGSTKFELDDQLKLVIEFTEEIIQKALIRMIELNKKFTHSKIDSALVNSMHITKTLNQLLGLESID